MARVRQQSEARTSADLPWCYTAAKYIRLRGGMCGAYASQNRFERNLSLAILEVVQDNNHSKFLNGSKKI